MPGRIGTSDLIILVTSAAAMAAVTLITFAIAPVESSPRVPGSSFSSEPAGTRAAYLLLQELGHHVRRSLEPIASLRSEPSSTTLILANPTERPSTGDQKAAAAFIRAGGTVVAFGLAADDFLPGVMPSLTGRRNQPLDLFQAALPGGLTRGTRELSAYRSPPPRLDPAYIPVYVNGENVAVVTARFGEGQVVWCLDETVIQNDGIVRGVNVNLIANAAGVPGARTIAWDEYYHGQRRSFWSYLAGTPLLWGVAQLGLVAVAVLAGASRRRGPLRPRIVEPRSSPLEFVDTMATLYERAGDARAAIEAARTKLRRTLALVAGMSVSAGDEQLVAAAAPRLGVNSERTRAALDTAAEALRRGIARSEDAVPIVAELQELSAAATVARSCGRRRW